MIRQTLKFLILPLLLALPATIQAQFTFTTNNGAITITGYTGAGGTVIIPNMTNGYPVTSVTAGFALNYNLTNIIIPDSVITLGGALGGVTMFEMCTNLRSATISSNVTIIGDDMFDGCSSLTSFTIGENVTNIGSCAFYRCTGLTNVIIGKAVTTIKGNAFGGCSRLPTVNIPKSVTNIFGPPFIYCANLKAINMDMNNPVYSSLDGVLLDKRQTIIIKYPEGKSGNYTIPNSVTSIGSSAFIYSVALNNLIIPDSVTSIGDYAFTFSSISGFYFKGSPPWVSGFYAFSGLTNATIYYLPGIAGWEYFPYGACSMAQWLLPYPLILNNTPSFGVQTNGFSFTISWATNISVIVEASTNLIIWKPMQTNTLTSGSAYFSDSQWTNYSCRFYRLRSP